MSGGQGAPQAHTRLRPTALGLECSEVDYPAPDPLPGVAQKQGEHLGRLRPPCQSADEICNVPVLKK